MSKVIDLPELEAGRQAVIRHAWREAFDLLSKAASHALLPAEDLEALAEAAWWTGRLEQSIDNRQLAYAEYLKDGKPAKAAMMACKLAMDHFGKMAHSIGRGWLSRAERLFEETPDAPERGFLLFIKAFQAWEAGEKQKSAELAKEMLEVGTRLGDPDVQALALLLRGKELVWQGQVDEGLALMDEATVAAVSGELQPLTTGVIYCIAIGSTTGLRDYRRAGEWSEAAKRWCERQSISGFPGICRVHRAQIMHLRGNWVEAEKDVRVALSELKNFDLETAAEGFYELGEIRLRMGDFNAARDAFRQAEEIGKEPQPGMAMLHMAEGNVNAAASGIKRALAEQSQEPLWRFTLLGPKVEIDLALGDLASAEAATDELEGIGETYGTAALRAGAAYARAAVLLARGLLEEAVRTLRSALPLWKQADVPYEAARTRVALAMAFRQAGDEESAVHELKAAASVFERLGAVPDLQKVHELLGGEGASGRRATPRVVKSFMFTDIVGSTKLVEFLGDEAWGHLLKWHDKTLRDLFVAYGGEEVKQAGDGFFVAFDQPSSALECAVAIQRNLSEHRRSHGFAPQVRIGLYCGEATRKQGDYEGKEVHKAARIGAMAGADEILAGRSFFEAAGGGWQAEHAETVMLKGIDEPVEIVKVAWPQ